MHPDYCAEGVDGYVALPRGEWLPSPCYFNLLPSTPLPHQCTQFQGEAQPQPSIPILGSKTGELIPSSTKPLVPRSVCTNTCPTARDGVCQDGRPGPGVDAEAFYATARNVTCDLGTDCADCGAWVTDASSEALAWAPVARLRDAGNTLLVKRVASPAGYLFGITDPALDTDVSRKVDATGVFEPILTMIWWGKGCCKGVRGICVGVEERGLTWCGRGYRCVWGWETEWR